MTRPYVGQHLYLDRHRERPITITGTFGTDPVYVQYVEGHVSLPSTHAGNLFAADNSRPFYK